MKRMARNMSILFGVMEDECFCHDSTRPFYKINYSNDHLLLKEKRMMWWSLDENHYGMQSSTPYHDVWWLDDHKFWLYHENEWMNSWCEESTDSSIPFTFRNLFSSSQTFCPSSPFEISHLPQHQMSLEIFQKEDFMPSFTKRNFSPFDIISGDCNRSFWFPSSEEYERCVMRWWGGKWGWESCWCWGWFWMKSITERERERSPERMSSSQQ